jgi:hypothetical protein
MSACGKQQDLTADNEVLFGLAGLENRDYQNWYYVVRNKEPIINCFRIKVPFFSFLSSK